jgi:hypothetical protein
MRSPILLRSLVALSILLVVAYFFFGNRDYGEVSDKAYEFATALYSVCNRQDASKLAGIESLLASAQSNDSLSSEEADMLQEILQKAKSGDWAIAASETRSLMVDQVKYP